MPYTTHDLLIIGVIMTLGSLLQGALGFASGLLGVPLLVLSGFSLVEATVINFLSTAVQNVAGAVQLWEHLEWRDVAWPTGLRAAALPLGMYALARSETLDQSTVKQIIGAVLLVSVLLLIALRVRPRDVAPFPWTAAAFLSSGFLMGFGAIGGAPMVMYVNSLTWSAAKSRGFIFFCSAALVPLMGVLLYWKFHEGAARPALAALVILPPVMLALAIGLRVGRTIDKARFRRLTYGLLIGVSLFALLAPLWEKGPAAGDPPPPLGAAPQPFPVNHPPS
ncbi:MAG TPA: TSUP family transporter [Lacipirellulaceae bacterium]|nr:TSUP family transporter [Lacipirellulaceae bacterium]